MIIFMWVQKVIESIPRDLDRSRTCIVDGIPIISLFIKSNKDLLIFAVFCLPALYILIATNLGIVAKLITFSFSVFLAIVSIVTGIPDKITDFVVLRSSLKRSGFNSKELDSFLPIKDIRNDCIILMDGRLIRVLETTGINLHLYDKSHQKNVIGEYRTFLNSLDFPIQIISKSEPVNIKSWIFSLDSRVKSQPLAKKVYKDFRSFIQKYLDENKIKKRRYFIVFESKKIFGKETEDLSIDELENKEAVVIDMCRRFGIKAKRVNTSELTNLALTYYSHSDSADKQYLSPITFSEGKHV